MSYLMMTVLALGVVLCTAAGFVWHLGPGSFGSHLDRLPQAELLLSHPAAALGVGFVMIVLSLVLQPTRVR